MGIRSRMAAWLAYLFPHRNEMRVAILVFVGIFLIALATRCHAADVRFDAGSAVVRGETPTLGMSLSWPGPLDTSLEAGFNLVGSSSYHGKSNPNQIFVHATLVDGFGPVDVGLGLATMQNEDVYNSGSLQFTLLLRWNVTERLSIGVRHFSNSGTGSPNKGRDLLTVGWKF